MNQDYLPQPLAAPELLCSQSRENIVLSTFRNKQTTELGSKEIYDCRQSPYCGTLLISDLIWEPHAWTANELWLHLLESHCQNSPDINISAQIRATTADDISELFSVSLLHLKTAVIPCSTPVNPEKKIIGLLIISSEPGGIYPIKTVGKWTVTQSFWLSCLCTMC